MRNNERTYNTFKFMIKIQLQNDLKEAMKAKDQVRLRTVRSLRAAIMAKEIELRTGGEGDIPDEDALAVIQKQAKQRRDAIDQFESAGRDDLKQIEEEELVVIESYLPKQLDEAEIRSVVQQIVESSGADGMKDMGKVMGAAMGQLRGKADGKLVQQAVRAILSGS